MQVVIDIPDRIHYGIEKGITVNGSEASQIVLDAVKNGTPLPKGHGKLGDLDALEKLCYEHKIGNSAFNNEPIIAQGQYDDGDSIWESLFDFAPTIIEADKAESEE